MILCALSTNVIIPYAIVVLAAIDGLSKHGTVNARNVLLKIIKFPGKKNIETAQMIKIFHKDREPFGSETFVRGMEKKLARRFILKLPGRLKKMGK